MDTLHEIPEKLSVKKPVNAVLVPITNSRNGNRLQLPFTSLDSRSRSPTGYDQGIHQSNLNHQNDRLHWSNFLGCLHYCYCCTYTVHCHYSHHKVEVHKYQSWHMANFGTYSMGTQIADTCC